MKNHPLVLAAAWIVSLSVTSYVGAENWPHWRGPTGNSVAQHAHPPTRIDPTAARWKVPVEGSGSGSPIVWNDRVYVTSALAVGGGRQRFLVHAFDRATGRLVWKTAVGEAIPHEPTHSTNTFASASPCTDGERVYAYFGSWGLHALDLDGELLWSRDLGDLQMRNGFGEGASPTLWRDRLFVPWDHEGASKLFAVDKTSGEVLWSVDREEPSNWGTPLVVSTDSGDQVVLTGENHVIAYDVSSGRELWRSGGQTSRPAASPVAGDGIVLVASGFRGSFAGAFDPTGRGNLEGTGAVRWTKNDDTPDISSPVLSGNRLYYTKAKTGVLSCVDIASGRPYYQRVRLPEIGTLYASPVAAGGYIYYCDRDGTIAVIKDGETYDVVSVQQLGEGIDATPAAVDRQLIIRGSENLYCFEDPVR